MKLDTTLEVKGLHKEYLMAFERLKILNDVNISATTGELVVVMGPSGSGKTTLISILAGLDSTYTGSVRVCDLELQELARADRIHLRSSLIGVVFQDHRLLPQLTAIENVEAPLYLRSMKKRERTSRAEHALELLKLSGRSKHKPSQLSGGERQRTAIARALVGGAKILFCDEPTGNLNRAMSLSIFQLLQDLCHRFGKTVILTTHDQKAVNYADRLLILENGLLQEKTVDKEMSDAIPSHL